MCGPPSLPANPLTRQGHRNRRPAAVHRRMEGLGAPPISIRIVRQTESTPLQCCSLQQRLQQSQLWILLAVGHGLLRRRRRSGDGGGRCRGGWDSCSCRLGFIAGILLRHLGNQLLKQAQAQAQAGLPLRPQTPGGGPRRRWRCVAPWPRSRAEARLRFEDRRAGRMGRRSAHSRDSWSRDKGG